MVQTTTPTNKQTKNYPKIVSKQIASLRVFSRAPIICVAAAAAAATTACCTGGRGAIQMRVYDLYISLCLIMFIFVRTFYF